MRKLITVLALASSLYALSQSKLPMSADHVFVPQDAIKNPQPTSFFSMTVGLQESGNVQLFNADLPILGPVDVDGEVVFVDFGVRGSIRLKEWISYRLTYNVAVRAGTDVGSLLVQGLNSLISYESLWQIRLYQTQKLYLSGTFGFNRIDADLVDVASYIRSIRDGVPDPSINRKIRSLTGEFGLQSSYAVNSVIGLLAEVDVEIGDHAEVETARVFWSARGSVDFNFNEKYNFPLGAAVTFISSTLPEFVVPVRRQAFSGALRLAYTGSEDYVIGLSVSRSGFPLEKVDDRTSFQGFSLMGRFFF